MSEKHQPDSSSPLEHEPTPEEKAHAARTPGLKPVAPPLTKYSEGGNGEQTTVAEDEELAAQVQPPANLTGEGRGTG